MATAGAVRERIGSERPDELERRFAGGRAPDPLPDGRYRGDVLAVTIAPPADVLLRGALRRWPPWLGKRFDAGAARGENAIASALVRAAVGTAPFVTSIGPSALDAALEVLRIDYDIPENPAPLRRILDEVIDVGDGILLGQALVRRGAGRPRRGAWFCLW